jgi:hypothetical protein
MKSAQVKLQCGEDSDLHPQDVLLNVGPLFVM